MLVLNRFMYKSLWPGHYLQVDEVAERNVVHLVEAECQVLTEQRLRKHAEHVHEPPLPARGETGPHTRQQHVQQMHCRAEVQHFLRAFHCPHHGHASVRVLAMRCLTAIIG